MHSGLANVPELSLFPHGHTDDLPDCYGIYQRLKRDGTYWWAGGLADQPHILMLELDACAAGETQYEQQLAPYLLKLDQMGRKG